MKKALCAMFLCFAVFFTACSNNSIPAPSVKAETPSKTESSSKIEYKPDEIIKAAYNGELEKVKEILNSKPDVDARDSFGGTALHAAMFQKNMEIVSLLLKYGYNPNAKGTSNGYTPLHDAVWANNIEAAKLLLANGVDITIKAADGKTAFEKAIAENKTEIAKVIQKN